MLEQKITTGYAGKDKKSLAVKKTSNKAYLQFISHRLAVCQTTMIFVNILIGGI